MPASASSMPQGRLDRLPRFKVITNGTILTAEIAQTVIRYNIQVVFSLDGPASIHDALRYFPGRNPSWQRILENFRRWRELHRRSAALFHRDHIHPGPY